MSDRLAPSYWSNLDDAAKTANFIALMRSLGDVPVATGSRATSSMNQSGPAYNTVDWKAIVATVVEETNDSDSSGSSSSSKVTSRTATQEQLNQRSSATLQAPRSSEDIGKALLEASRQLAAAAADAAATKRQTLQQATKPDQHVTTPIRTSSAQPPSAHSRKTVVDALNVHLEDLLRGASGNATQSVPDAAGKAAQSTSAAQTYSSVPVPSTSANSSQFTPATTSQFTPAAQSYSSVPVPSTSATTSQFTPAAQTYSSVPIPSTSANTSQFARGGGRTQAFGREANPTTSGFDRASYRAARRNSASVAWAQRHTWWYGNPVWAGQPYPGRQADTAPFAYRPQSSNFLGQAWHPAALAQSYSGVPRPSTSPAPLPQFLGWHADTRPYAYGDLNSGFRMPPPTQPTTAMPSPFGNLPSSSRLPPVPLSATAEPFVPGRSSSSSKAPPPTVPSAASTTKHALPALALPYTLRSSSLAFEGARPQRASSALTPKTPPGTLAPSSPSLIDMPDLEMVTRWAPLLATRTAVAGGPPAQEEEAAQTSASSGGPPAQEGKRGAKFGAMAASQAAFDERWGGGSSSSQKGPRRG